MKILLVDDDVDLSLMLQDYLEQEGFDVVAVQDGKTAVTEALSDRYVLIVLDIMMPRLNGIDALQRIRAASQVPVLMLTAKGDDTDRIAGLELGADDYVPKPCTPRELTARIRAILRRTRGSSATSNPDVPLVAGFLLLWPEKRLAALDGLPIKLTSTEFNLLEVLVRHAGHPVSKNTLSEEGLGRSLTRYDRNIDVHISSLRRKLSQLNHGNSYLQTVYRLGYQLTKE